MGQITSRTLATSLPRNLTTGFPLIPLNTTIDQPVFPTRIGGGNGETESFRQPILDVRIPLVFWRFTGTFNVGLFAGSFFGINLQYTVDGVTRDDGTAIVRFANDAAAGGIGFGLSLTLDFFLRLERSAGIRFTPGRRFPNTFTTVWEDIFNRSFSANIDLINIALTVLRGVGIPIPLDLVRGARTVGTNGAIWGLFDEVENQFLRNQGRLQLRPRVALSPNILDFVPPAQPVVRALKTIGSKLFCGPTLNIVFPITLNIVRLTTEDGDYEVTEFRNGRLFFDGGPVATLPPTVSQVTVTHSHAIGIEFTLAMRAGFQFLAVINLSVSVPIPLNFGAPEPPLRAENVLGPFFTALSDNGAVAVDMPEVVWG